MVTTHHTDGNKAKEGISDVPAGEVAVTYSKAAQGDARHKRILECYRVDCLFTHVLNEANDIFDRLFFLLQCTQASVKDEKPCLPG